MATDRERGLVVDDTGSAAGQSIMAIVATSTDGCRAQSRTAAEAWPAVIFVLTFIVILLFVDTHDRQNRRFARTSHALIDIPMNDDALCGICHVA
jgi:hypothetical protein